MSNFLDLNWGPILWTVLNFSLLAILLRILAWKPVLAALENRERSISEALDRAEQARIEADRVLAENHKALARVEDESQKMLRDSRDYASRLQAEAHDKAQEDARKLMAQAREDIEHLKQQALNELRVEVAQIAVGAAEKILGERLDVDRSRKLVDDYFKGTVQASN